MTGITGPLEYSWGLGEVIRAHRVYIGISQLAMAKEIGIAVRSYERMEAGTKECPPGFLDTLKDVVVAFDDAVDVIAFRLTEFPNTYDHSPRVHSDVNREWDRAVLARVSLSVPIVPKLMD